MPSASLTASSRSDAGKGVARKLRAAGRIPAVIYGRARTAQAIDLSTRDLERLLEKVAYETTVIDLSIDGKVSRTLIRDIQRHPFRKLILHVDFQELVAGEKVTVKIPLVFVGTSVGVRLGGGIMDQVMRELSCRVDPANIPNHIDVDVTEITIGHSLHVGDLKIPAGVEVLDGKGETVVVVAAPKAVEEPTPGADAAAPAEPELIRKTKADEDAEAAEKDKDKK